MIPDYTLVVALDAKHLYQFSLTWPTWKKNKPSLLSVPMVVIYDGLQISEGHIRGVVDHPNKTMVDWNQLCADSYGQGADKWYNPRRVKMISSFVHVPGSVVKTPYWLKMDTDATATGMDDWIDPTWFDDDPAIISHPWGFTRPPDQMEFLDSWVASHPELVELNQCCSLDLHPAPGANRLSHPRIGSWCAFFKTSFTSDCSEWASQTCGKGLIPVPSQDGYTWYVAKRLGLGIVRPRMKSRGWQLWSTDQNIQRSAMEAMSNG